MDEASGFLLFGAAICELALVVGFDWRGSRRGLKQAARSLGFTVMDGEIAGVLEGLRVEVQSSRVRRTARICVDTKGRIPRAIIIRSRDKSRPSSSVIATGDRHFDARFYSSGDAHLLATMLTAKARNAFTEHRTVELKNGKVIVETGSDDIESVVRKSVALAKLLCCEPIDAELHLVDRLKNELNPLVRATVFDRILAGAPLREKQRALELVLESRERELLIRALPHTGAPHATRLLQLLRSTPDTDDELRARLVCAIPDHQLELTELKSWISVAGPKFRTNLIRAIGKKGSKEEVLLLLSRQLEHEDADVRNAASDALRELNTSERSGLETSDPRSGGE